MIFRKVLKISVDFFLMSRYFAGTSAHTNPEKETFCAMHDGSARFRPFFQLTDLVLGSALAYGSW